MVGASLEAIYLAHILQTLSRLQDTFPKKDTEVFSLYIEYVRSVVLNDDISNKIDHNMAALKESLKQKGIDDGMIDFHMGFAVVREVMRYLNTSLDLTHEDIIGKAYDLEKITFAEESKDAGEPTAAPD
jgi:hypothetical protein